MTMKFPTATVVLATVAVAGFAVSGVSAGCLDAVVANAGKDLSSYLIADGDYVNEEYDDNDENADADEAEENKDDEKEDGEGRALSEDEDEDKDKEEENDEDADADADADADGQGSNSYYYLIQSKDDDEGNVQTTMENLAYALGLNGDDTLQISDLTYVAPYDENLAALLEIRQNGKQRETFAKFYDRLLELTRKGECSAGWIATARSYVASTVDKVSSKVSSKFNKDDEEDEYEQQQQQNDEAENEQEEEQAEEGEEEEEEAENQAQAQAQEDDIVKTILSTCQTSFGGLGVNLDGLDFDNDDGTIEKLATYIKMDAAIADGVVSIEYGYDQAMQDVMDNLGFDEEDLDDTLKVKLAVESGELTNYLQENGAYGNKVNDWDEILANFLGELGLENDDEDISEVVDSYLAADIYNAELDLEEQTCQATMAQQFGEKNAANLGFISSKGGNDENFGVSPGTPPGWFSSLTDAAGLSDGAITGIAVGAAILALVLFYCLCCCRCCKKKSDRGEEKGLVSRRINYSKDSKREPLTSKSRRREDDYSTDEESQPSGSARKSRFRAFQCMKTCKRSKDSSDYSLA